MSDTPRTDAVLASYFNPGPSRLCDLARELERELNSANATIHQQQLLEEENMRLKAQVIGPSALIDELEIQRDSIAKQRIGINSRRTLKVSDDLQEWLKTIPVVTDADKAELRESITRLEAQQRGTRTAESMLCEILAVDDGSQILDAIQGLKERIKRLEEAGDALTNCIACGCNDGGCRICRKTEDNWIKAKETKP